MSELFLGAMTFGEQGGVGTPPEECRRILDAYADAGGNVVDTAINYRGGASEEIVGELLAGRRDRFVVGTKYTVSRDRDDPNAAGNHRKNLRLSLETSLRRLRTDYIDIYWVHIWDRHTPIEETMRALDDEVGAGRILYVGISDTPAWVVSHANTLAHWHGWTRFAGLQVPYNLLQRDIERDLLPMAEAFGMTVTTWSPLAGGILSGKFTQPDGPPAPGTRVNPASLTDHQCRVATVVQSVADDSAPARHRSPSPGRGPDHRPSTRSSAPAASTSSSTTSAHWTSTCPLTRWRSSSPSPPSTSASPRRSSTRPPHGSSAQPNPTEPALCLRRRPSRAPTPGASSV